MATSAKKAKTEEEKLSTLLFNNTDDFVEKFPSNKKKISKKENPHSEAWYDEDDEIDVGAALKLQGRRLPSGGVNDSKGKYSNLVKHKYELLVGTPEWAHLDREVKTDPDSEVLQTVGHIDNNRTKALSTSLLEFKRLKYLNNETGNEGPIIKAIEFHPTSSVALVAGLSGITSLVAVDGVKNEKLHSMAFKKYPIHCARFSLDGSHAFLGSVFPHFYVYDLINAKALRVPLPNTITKMSMFEVSKCGKYIAIGGRFGEVHLICAKSKELIKTLKQNGDVTALVFSSDGTKLYSHSSEGHVTVWSMSSLRVVHKWYDDGCITGSSLAISPSGEYFATGSAQGVVNIYNTKNIESSSSPQPEKVILNLTTSISSVKFNSNSEILGIVSSHSQNAIRLIHIPSFQVFKNFPGLQPNYAHCNIINFSPNSGYLSFGNNKNLAYLYRLKYYNNY